MNHYAQESYHKTLRGEVESNSQSLDEARAKRERLWVSIKDKKSRLEQILMDYYQKTRNQVQRSMARVFKSKRLIANVCSFAAAWMAANLAGFFAFNTAAFPKGVPWWWIFFGLLAFFVAFYVALRYIARGLALFGLRVDFNEGKSINPLFTVIKWSGISFLATLAALLASLFLISGPGSDLFIIAQIAIELELILFSGSCAVLAGFFGHVFKLSEEIEAEETELAKVEGQFFNLQRALGDSEAQLAHFQHALMQAAATPMLPPGAVNHTVSHLSRQYDYE
jgi:hypothetical protein